ncbi:MAG: hypothetical protein ACK4RN_11225 [Pseudorhodobacter sp.]
MTNISGGLAHGCVIQQNDRIPNLAPTACSGKVAIGLIQRPFLDSGDFEVRLLKKREKRGEAGTDEVRPN